MRTHVAGKQPRRALPNRDGSSSVEYAVVLGLICVVGLAALSTLGVNSQKVFDQVQSALQPGKEPHTKLPRGS